MDVNNVVYSDCKYKVNGKKFNGKSFVEEDEADFESKSYKNRGHDDNDYWNYL